MAEASEPDGGEGGADAPHTAAPAPAPGRRPRRSLADDLKKLPNQLTLARLALCGLFFAVLIYCSEVLQLPVDAEGQLHYQRLRGDMYEAHAGLRGAAISHLTWLLNGAFVAFVIAALSDIADGYIARRWGLESDFGRIADPFVDKIMILGSLVLMMPLTIYITGWMVVLVLGRELLVSGIRGFAESRGVAFPASMSGKIKMLLQSAAVGAGLLYLGHPESAFLRVAFLALWWGALVSTVVSGVTYVLHAGRLLFPGAPPALGGAAGGRSGRNAGTDG